MTNRPTIENATGLTWRPCKAGWTARWRPRHDLVVRGYPPTPQRLWVGTEPTDIERKWISDRCNAMQDEMLLWGRGGLPQVRPFDGTLRSLASCYQTDPDSPYRKLQYRTGIGYDYMIKRIVDQYGEQPLGDGFKDGEPIDGIKGRTLLRWHEGWTAGGKVSFGHSMIGMLRTMFGFGATILESKECERLCSVMHKMKFKMGQGRGSVVTAEQATAVRRKANELGLVSIALAQAFQFDCTLRQKDVIGEWLPLSEPGISEVTEGNDKWLKGLRWEEIDANMILTHMTSKRQKIIVVDLKLAPMVLEELAKLGDLPSTGPIIVSETRGRPFYAHEWRRDWRAIARAAGVPDDVFNMDSRAGAITEAIAAGASLEDTRHAATHSNISMTQRYSREPVKKTATVMTLRAAHRNKP